MREKIKQFFGPQENYMRDFRIRLKWFLWIMGTFFVFIIAQLVAIFTIDYSWDDSTLYILFFLYLACFTGFNWFRFHQNSVHEERKNHYLTKLYGITPFDHKKGRRSVAKISVFSILINLIMIVLHLTVL